MTQLTAEVFLKLIDIIVTLHPETLNKLLKFLKETNQDLVVFLQSMQKYLVKNYAYDKKLLLQRKYLQKNSWTCLWRNNAQTWGLNESKNPKYEIDLIK